MIIEQNGKRYRVVEELGPVRGPLGGELVSLFDAPTDVPMCGRFIKHPYSNGNYKLEQPNGLFATVGKEEITEETKKIFEVNIQPRPTFTPMTAGDAAKVPGIVGRWVAVKVDDYGHNYIRSQECNFVTTDKILLIEGVDLP